MRGYTPLRKNLPIDLLRSFVAIAEHGSLSAAADSVFLTQSALSLQMKKLADYVELPLLERHHRGVILTSNGRTLLGYAEAILHLNDEATAVLTDQESEGPVRIGMIQDFAEGLLSNVLIRFSQRHPNASINIRIGTSRELSALLAGGVIDIAIGLGDADHPSGVVKLPVLWLGHENALRLDGAVRLVVMEKPCLFREQAVRSLEASRIPYSIVMETPNLGVLCAAVNAGIGVTCRSAAFLPDRLPVLNILDTPLSEIAVTLSTPVEQSPRLRYLTGLLRSTINSLDRVEPRRSISPD